MIKYGDIVDGDLTEYEYSDSEDSDSSVDETEDDEIQTNQYIRKCNMARTKLTDKKRRAALLRQKPLKSFLVLKSVMILMILTLLMRINLIVQPRTISIKLTSNTSYNMS